MIRCLSCKETIENPREYKGKVIQKFCSDKCRYDYHNRIKREERFFVKEAMSLLRKISRDKGDSL
jgi:predicted nucleic acid-binding Zn ribbon protein